MSNMDVWNVMWGETLDASKLGVVQEDGTLKKDKDGNIILTDMNWINSFITTGKLTKGGNIVKGNNGKALIEQTYFLAEEDPNDKTKTIKVEYDLIPKKLKNKITDFESLMREGKNLTFDSRKAVLLKLFGTPVNNYKKGAQIETIANGVPLHRIIKLTSAFPDAQVGDLVGLVKFEINEDGTAKTGKAQDMGVPSHPSYDTVIMGEGIARFDTPVKLDDWGRDWLMTDRESKQKPFFQKDQKAFEDRIGAILHTPAMLEFLRGESKTMPKTLEEQQSKPQSPDKMRASAKRVLELAPGQKNLKINKRMFSDDIRFAKKKGQQTAAELETEWRKKGVKVKPDTKVPEDKVTLGNKKDAGGLYSRESIKGIKHVSSDANLIDGDVVRTAKIFERSAGAHAIATRSWNPLKPLTDKWTTALQPYSDMLTKHIVAQGTLPDSAKYKALRRVVKGLILNAEDGGRAQNRQRLSLSTSLRKILMQT